MRQVDLIKQALERFGDRFTGTDAKSMAQEWRAHNFSANDVEAWCEIGVWEPEIAAKFRDAGATPQDIAAAVERMTDDIHPDDLAERWTDGDPIYSACNYDTPVSEILGHCPTR